MHVVRQGVSFDRNRTTLACSPCMLVLHINTGYFNQASLSKQPVGKRHDAVNGKALGVHSIWCLTAKIAWHGFIAAIQSLAHWDTLPYASELGCTCVKQRWCCVHVSMMMHFSYAQLFSDKSMMSARSSFHGRTACAWISCMSFYNQLYMPSFQYMNINIYIYIYIADSKPQVWVRPAAVLPARTERARDWMMGTATAWGPLWS